MQRLGLAERFGCQQNQGKKNIPSLKLKETNSSHLKMDGWNTNFLLERSFSGAMLVLGSVHRFFSVVDFDWLQCGSHFHVILENIQEKHEKIGI